MWGRDRTSFVARLVFIVLGVLFLLEQLNVLEVRPGLVLPIVLVAFGVALLIGRSDRDRHPPPPPPPPSPPSAE